MKYFYSFLKKVATKNRITMKPNIVLTGFEPFGAYQENLSEEIALQFVELSGYEIWGSVFSVGIFKKDGQLFDQGDLAVRLAMEYNSKAIISLGIASSVTGIQIETQASNWVENQKYCKEHEQKRKLSADLFAHDLLKIDLKPWKLEYPSERFELFKKFQVENPACEINFSKDPGTFCCNALIFSTLMALKRHQCKIPFLFAHIPSVKNPDSASKIKKSLEILISRLA